MKKNIRSIRYKWIIFKTAKFSGLKAIQEESESESSVSGPTVVYKRQGKKTDAWLEWRHGRSPLSYSLRTFSFSPEAEQDRDAAAGEELHLDARQRPGGDEEAGDLPVPHSRGAPACPALGPRPGSPPSLPTQPRVSVCPPAPAGQSSHLLHPSLSPLLWSAGYNQWTHINHLTHQREISVGAGRWCWVC